MAQEGKLDTQPTAGVSGTGARKGQPPSRGNRDEDLGRDALCWIYFPSKILYSSQLLETERLKHGD